MHINHKHIEQLLQPTLLVPMISRLFIISSFHCLTSNTLVGRH